MRDDYHWRKPRALYRFFGERGVLLYVGVAVDPKQRFRQHARKPWWQSVERIEVEWYDDSLSAEDAETAAIWQEGPLYNIVNPIVDQHRPLPGERSDDVLTAAEGVDRFLNNRPRLQRRILR